MNVQSKPCGLSIILCDDIIEDKHSGKKSLIGIFNGVSSFHFPFQLAKMVIFITLMGGNGKYKVKMRIKNPQHKHLIEAEGEIEINHPFQVVDLTFALYNIPFSLTGRYVIEFLCNDEFIFERHFMAEQKKGSKQ